MFIYDLIQIEHPCNCLLVAAECQKLADQGVCPLACLYNLQQHFLNRIILFKCPLSQFRVAVDYLQNIVKIVCDSSGKLSYRFHFLRLAQLFLKRMSVG